jgi:hypothetical protein
MSLILIFKKGPADNLYEGSVAADRRSLKGQYYSFLRPIRQANLPPPPGRLIH